jgi:hypothetical protein
LGETQSLTEEHVMRQLPLLCWQMYGAQSVTPPSGPPARFLDVCESTHVAPPLGTPQMPLTQEKPVLHWSLAVHAAPLLF